MEKDDLLNLGSINLERRKIALAPLTLEQFDRVKAMMPTIDDRSLRRTLMHIVPEAA